MTLMMTIQRYMKKYCVDLDTDIFFRLLYYK